MAFVRIAESLMRSNVFEVEEASIFSSVAILLGDKNKYDGLFRKCGIGIIEADIPDKGRVHLASGYLSLNFARIFPITVSADHLFIKIIKYESVGDQRLLIDGNDAVVIQGIASEELLIL